MFIRLLSIAFLASAVFAGFYSAPSQAEKKCADSVHVTDMFVREVIPGQTNSAAFMNLENHGTVTCHLINVLSPVANLVELHDHFHDEDGVFRMRAVEKITIKAFETVELKRGGLHVMLMQLNQELKENDEIPLTLIYEDGSQDIWYPGVKSIFSEDEPRHKHRY